MQHRSCLHRVVEIEMELVVVVDLSRSLYGTRSLGLHELEELHALPGAYVQRILSTPYWLVVLPLSQSSEHMIVAVGGGVEVLVFK